MCLLQILGRSKLVFLCFHSYSSEIPVFREAAGVLETTGVSTPGGRGLPSKHLLPTARSLGAVGSIVLCAELSRCDERKCSLTTALERLFRVSKCLSRAAATTAGGTEGTEVPSAEREVVTQWIRKRREFSEGLEVPPLPLTALALFLQVNLFVCVCVCVFV